jgi:hypothetical protein
MSCEYGPGTGFAMGVEATAEISWLVPAGPRFSQIRTLVRP